LPVGAEAVQKEGLAKNRQLPVQNEERDQDVHGVLGKLARQPPISGHPSVICGHHLSGFPDICVIFCNAVRQRGRVLDCALAEPPRND
jgi:hypothetical protein